MMILKKWTPSFVLFTLLLTVCRGEAAATMGAGICECDVTVTKDRERVCRHSQCDLATTTNILTIPEFAAKCSKPFTPATVTFYANCKGFK
jgi:hypothetical protein